jgi:hypothetical protein
LEFQALKLENIGTLRPFFADNPRRLCDCTVGGTFMWRDMFETEFAVEGGALYLKVKYLTGETAFAPPLGDGADSRAAYERILAYCRERELAPRLCSVSEGKLASILALYPSAAAVTDRAWSDYLYSAEDIRALAGRKYSGQRNHINKFLKAYPDWTFEPVGEANRNAARGFILAYSREHIKDYPAYDEGNRKTLEVIDNLPIYGQIGGVLRAEGVIVGAAFGEEAGDTLFIHAEKALTEYTGAYQMVVNQFAKRFAHDGIAYINREEDDGVEGLRVSKLSYHPAALLDKYVVEL